MYRRLRFFLAFFRQVVLEESHNRICENIDKADHLAAMQRILMIFASFFVEDDVALSDLQDKSIECNAVFMRAILQTLVEDFLASDLDTRSPRMDFHDKRVDITIPSIIPRQCFHSEKKCNGFIMSIMMAISTDPVFHFRVNQAVPKFMNSNSSIRHGEKNTLGDLIARVDKWNMRSVAIFLKEDSSITSVQLQIRIWKMLNPEPESD